MKKQNEGQSVSVKGSMKEREKKKKIGRNWFIKFLIKRKKIIREQENEENGIKNYKGIKIENRR